MGTTTAEVDETDVSKEEFILAINQRLQNMEAAFSFASSPVVVDSGHLIGLGGGAGLAHSGFGGVGGLEPL